MKLIYYIFLVLWFATPLVSQAQVTKTKDLDKKSKSKYDKALKLYADGQVYKSIDKLEEVVEDNPNFKKGLEKLAGIYLETKQNEFAIQVIDDLLDIGPNPKATVSMSYALEATQDYEGAKAVLKPLLINPKLSENKKKIIQIRYDELVYRQNALENTADFEPIRFTDAVNSDDIEYHPVFNADGSRIFYVRVSGKGKYLQEDLYYADRISEPGEPDSFAQGQPIEELNTEGQEGAFTLSQDGNILIFTACDWPGSLGGCDLYISFRKSDGWSDARNMGKVINSRFWDAAPSLSADGRTLYFSSKRSGGQGGSDIWMTSLSAQNRWTTPRNLGPHINTPKNDEAPYLHPDNQTLYFASEGHQGLGSYDIFMSRLGDDDKWSKAHNLGYPINTSSREGGLFVDLAGERAYYSSQIDLESDSTEFRGGDIYYFDLPAALKPTKVTYLQVKVIDAVTKKPLNASAEILALDAKKGTQPARFTTDATGKVLSTITPGEYAVSISKKGYLFHSEHLILDTIATDKAKPITYMAELVPIALPQSSADIIPDTEPVILKNIFFESGSAVLLDKSNNEINKLLNLLEKNDNLKIKITGHTDNVGQEAANLALSEARAKAVHEALVSKGIDPVRLSYEGIGEKEPIATNDSEDGRQANRRTEFVIIH